MSEEKSTPLEVQNPEYLPDNTVLVGRQEDWIPSTDVRGGAALTPHAMLATMVRLNPTPETLEKMIGLAERYDAIQAKKAYTAAMTAFKKDCPPVLEKTKKANFESKRGPVEYNWTPLEDILAVVTPHLSKHGLSIDHDIDQSAGAIRATCVVSHELGHSERKGMSAEVDKRNSLLSSAQQCAVALTQLRRHTTLAALGLATADLADEETAGAQAAMEGKRQRHAASGRADKEQVAELAKLLQQVGPALKKKHQMVFDMAKRGKPVDLEPVIDELAASLEPGGK